MGLFKKKKLTPGIDSINLSSNRTLLPAITTGAGFPMGVLGFIPVVTEYKDARHICYMVCGDENILRLKREIETYNEVLDEASSLCSHEFGDISNVEAAATQEGWAFTRVDYSPVKKTGEQNQTPLTVRLETSHDFCSQDSYSGIIKYSIDGMIKKLEITHWVTPFKAFKVTATRSRDQFGIRKIEMLGETSKDNQVIFKDR